MEEDVLDVVVLDANMFGSRGLNNAVQWISRNKCIKYVQ
jgi:hypothetical protein